MNLHDLEKIKEDALYTKTEITRKFGPSKRKLQRLEAAGILVPKEGMTGIYPGTSVKKALYHRFQIPVRT
jgi:hypothetical protein